MREKETEEGENRSKRERANGYKGESNSCSYLGFDNPNSFPREVTRQA